MLDFSMGEIGLIAAVALVVLGPDKLPQVAKTAGTLMGRAQRFVSQVKNDIDKEVELSELKKIQEDARKMAADLQSNLKNTTDQIEKQVKEVSDSVNNAGQDLKSQVDSATKDIKDSWMDSTSPKAELSMENIIEQKPEEAVKPAEVGDWGDLDRQIDTSSLESAFNWHETGRYPARGRRSAVGRCACRTETRACGSEETNFRSCVFCSGSACQTRLFPC